MKTMLMGAMLLISPMVCIANEPLPKQNMSSSNKAQATPIYLIHMSGASTGYKLENLEAVDFHGIKCITGKHVNATWVKNRIIYIPVDKISVIVEYPSLSEYLADSKAFKKNQQKTEGTQPIK